MLKLLSVKKIWDLAPHNGLTDLIEFDGVFLCCFREGPAHKGELSNGSIRILKSENKEDWTPLAFLSKEGIDLRDPHLSIAPDGRLMLTLGGSFYKNQQYVGCYPQVAFSEDGKTWSTIEQIPLPEEWIWSVTWNKGTAYGFSYRLSNPQVWDAPWILSLFKTTDGKSYDLVKIFDIPDHPSETTIRFLKDDTMVAFLRTRRHALIGNSKFPYTDWVWHDSGHCLGAPNFLILNDGTMWASGRDYEVDADDTLGYTEGTTAIGPMTLTKYTPELFLPSGGDNSYTGMIYKDNIFYISYYSSHEGKPSIYFAKVALK